MTISLFPSTAHKEHLNPITLSAFIANNTIPPISVRAEIIEEGQLPVLVISVPKAYSGGVATNSGKILRRRLKADGTPENVPMYPAEMATRLSDLRLLDYGKPLPDYSASTSVTVSLFIPRSAPDIQLAKLISDEQNRLGRPLPLNTLLVLNHLKDAPHSDIHQISKALNLTNPLVKVVLEKAVESGLLEAFGSGRSRNYILSSKLYTDKEKNIGYVRQADIDETRHLELILNLARKNEYIARADVVQLLHESSNRAYYLLKKLVDAGQLVPINKGRYAKYCIKK